MKKLKFVFESLRTAATIGKINIKKNEIAVIRLHDASLVVKFLNTHTILNVFRFRARIDRNSAVSFPRARRGKKRYIAIGIAQLFRQLLFIRFCLLEPKKFG